MGLGSIGVSGGPSQGQCCVAVADHLHLRIVLDDTERAERKKPGRLQFEQPTRVRYLYLGKMPIVREVIGAQGALTGYS